MNGFVLQSRSGHFKIQLSTTEIVDAVARKKSLAASNRNTPIVVGDFVECKYDGQTYTIEKVLPRKTLIQRGSEKRRGKNHTIIANADHALIVFAAKQPTVRVQAIDRYLVSTEYQNLNVCLAFNKWDLCDNTSSELMEIYKNAGYPCLTLKAVDEPKETLASILELPFEKLYILGPSGVGKTSIINAIFPNLKAMTSAVNSTTGKGRHTTTHIEFLPLSHDRFIADTPGLGQLTMIGIQPHNLKNYYREFLPLADLCHYRNCLHLTEPGCQVKENVGTQIHQDRYNSYLAFYDDLSEEADQLSQKSKK